MINPAISTLSSIDLREVWQGETGKFAKAVLTGIGFSFQFGGKTIGPDIPRDWQQAFNRDAARSAVSKTTLTHEMGLVVTREMRVFADAGAVEYTVAFRNSSRKTLPVLSAIQSLNLSFGEPIAEGNCVIASGGGLFDGFLPPRSFAIRKHCFAPTTPDHGTVELATEGGRSSNKDLPFFFIHNKTQKAGAFVAFGWSGQWTALVQRSPVAGKLNVTGKIPDLEIALEPGEEIKGPTILIGVYDGSLADGSNRLRRLIREHYTPKLAGQPCLPLAVYDNFWNIGLEFDEPLLKRLADTAAELEQEYFLLDAGWYAGCGTQQYDFSPGLGNWYEIDQKRLPNGLEPVAGYIRSKGLKFGLWFEPERVAPGSQLAQEHPDWILWEREKEPETIFRDWNKGYGLLDYGRPEVQKWVREMLDQLFGQYGIKYIRYDFNMDPLSYWNANDRSQRRGVTQLKHIQGLYSIIDWLRERHPETVLEGCASGGRRIDLETARRFHTFWISDHTADPSIVRYHLFGINYFLPGNYNYVLYTLPLTHQKDFQPDDLGFQSLFGGAFGLGGRVHEWSQALREKALLHIRTWKKVRRYLMEDYYPLSAQPADIESWSGWQFHDPKDQSGFVQTFRTNMPDEAHRFYIHGLERNARYRFADAYGAHSFEIDGAKAMREGIEVKQEPMSSTVLVYTKLPAY